MSTDDLRLSPTSYVVLGIVAMRGPSTPYDLKRAVGHSVGYFWPFRDAQLYSEPRRLASAGLLDLASEDTGRRRQLYSVTPDGLRTLRDWLAEPTHEQMQVRDVAELKLFFSEFARPTDIVSLAEQQVLAHQQRLATYEQIRQRFVHREDVADRLVPLELGLELERAALQFWTRLVAERLAAVDRTNDPRDRYERAAPRADASSSGVIRAGRPTGATRCDERRSPTSRW